MKQSRVDLDGRKAADIREQIKTLSKVYVPEWHFDTKNPDIGSVIAMIFADQVAENTSRYDELLDVYHAELANMAGVSLMPAQPASTMVVMELSSGLINGSYVAKGTKIYGGEGEDRVIFETAHPMYITSSKLTDILSTDSKTGAIRNIYGPSKRMALMPELEGITAEEGVSEEGDAGAAQTETETAGFKPFAAFDDCGSELGRNGLLIFHSFYFDIKDEKILMKIDSPDDLAKKIVNGTYRLSYLTEKGLSTFDEIKLIGEDVLCLKKSGDCRKIMRDREYSVFVIEAAEAVNDHIRVKGIEFSSEGEKQPFKSASTLGTDLDPTNFRPFGDKLAMFQECFMRHDDYFSRVGAKITVSFDVEFGVNPVTMSYAQIEDSLKVVKRKPHLAINTRVVESFVDEISIEYSSKTGWKRLMLMSDESEMFAAGEAGRRSFSFIAPEDWIEDGGRGRAIRFQTVRCNNCYMMPCNHNYPIIKNATVEYTYGDSFVRPERVEVVNRIATEDATMALMSGKGITAFRVSPYTDNALYFGFDRKFSAGPISMLMVLEDESAYVGTTLRFEYSTIDGFKPLQVIDKTDSLARTGQLRFIPSEDMAATTIEGRKRFWLRILDVNGHFGAKGVYRPVIKNLIINAVDVSNIDTHVPEDFYILKETPSVRFNLSSSNILDAQVWVNEVNKHTTDEMKEIMSSDPDKAYAEYDTYGNINDFFVLWEEVGNFDRSHEGDRHYVLDRQQGSVVFGDGVHVAVPSVTDSTAVRVIARSCSDADANVRAGELTDTTNRIDFLGGIYNPFPAYGGSSIESVDSAVNRAANIIGSRNRIVTMADYKNEILSFSDSINKAECIIGESVDGRVQDGLISIVLLMKDFGQGTHSFDRLVPKLREHLESCVELTAGFDTMEIVEPVGVAINVDIWMNRMSDETDYEVGLKLTEALEAFLSPVSDSFHPGWDIGKLPGRSQIMMKLNSLKTGAFIRRLVITGTYSDADGRHECDLEDLPGNRFYVVKSGTHRAHTIREDRVSNI